MAEDFTNLVDFENDLNDREGNSKSVNAGDVSHSNNHNNLSLT